MSTSHRLVVLLLGLPLAALARPDFPASPPSGWRLPPIPLPAPPAVDVPATLPVELPDGTVEQMDLEDYLKGVLVKELGPSFPAEALKAQAVAARSYAVYYTLTMGPICTTTACQVWGPEHTPETDAAVEATRGQVMTWQGSVAPVFFAASCGGQTLDASEVWSGQAPWLTPAPCVENKVGACDVVCTSERPADDTCWGIHGHRVGLCQRGAQAMALCGTGYRDILAHYAGNATLIEPGQGADVVEASGASEGDEPAPAEVAEVEGLGEDEVVEPEEAEPGPRGVGGCAVGPARDGVGWGWVLLVLAGACFHSGSGAGPDPDQHRRSRLRPKFIPAKMNPHFVLAGMVHAPDAIAGTRAAEHQPVADRCRPRGVAREQDPHSLPRAPREAPSCTWARRSCAS